MAKKELQVSAIENGTVIDHIPADKLFDVINVLGITGMDNAMTFGANLKSSKLGKKAIIKIWDKFLEDDEDETEWFKYEEKLPIALNAYTNLYEYDTFCYTNFPVIIKNNIVYKDENRKLIFN